MWINVERGNVMDLKNWTWTREPAKCEMRDGVLIVTTAPHTDLWQRTYYHFRNDNAPVFQMETEEKYFLLHCEDGFRKCRSPL